MSNSSSSQEDASSDVDNSERDIAPSHYVLDIESFSSLTKMLSEGGLQHYQSKIFEASGYKWKFSLYPNGDAKRKCTGYISVFLRIEDTGALPKGWEIYTDLKFFIFDQERDKYCIFQDGVKRFHRLKPECGIAKLVPRNMFDDVANGYLVNDRCAFGVEVFVLDSKFAGEYLSPLVKVDKTFTWRVFNYNKLSHNKLFSNEFDAGSFKWKLSSYPNGKHLALFVVLVDPQVTFSRLFVHFKLCLINQKSEQHRELQASTYFDPSSSLGYLEFVPLADLRDESKGFFVDNCIIIEALIKSVSTIDS